MRIRTAVFSVALLFLLGAAGQASAQVYYRMDMSSGAYPNAGWPAAGSDRPTSAFPTNADWTRSHVPGAGPAGENVIEMRQLPNGGAGNFYWGWSGYLESSDPPRGARRYYRWRMYFMPTCNFYGLNPDGPTSITNKVLLVGDTCPSPPCRVIVTYRTNRTEPRIGYFRVQIDGGASLIETGPYDKGQWLDVQVELVPSSSSSTANGGYRIWINNNDYNNPTAGRMNIVLNPSYWRYILFGGYNNEGIETDGVHTWRHTGFEASTAFDPNWHRSGGTTPSPCTFSVSPTSVSAPAGGTIGQIAVSASPSGCSPDSWTASENSSWITITSGSSGSGPGTVSYTVSANTGSSRSAAITVAGRSVTITQAAASSTPTPCTFSISPTSASVAASGGSGQVAVSVGPSGCSPSSWTASSNASWATITSGSSGSGSGTVGYSVASNSGGSRTGTLSIAGRSFTISQAAGSTPTDTRLPFSSTFDAGNFDEWDGFRNTTGVTLPSQGCYSGRCMRSPLVEGTNSDNYGDFYFGDHTGIDGSKVEEAWLRTWSKFDSGMSWPNRGQKIAVLNLTDGVTSERRYQVTLYVNPSGQYAIERSDLGTWTFSGLPQNIGSVAAVRLGQWDKLKVYARLNTPGSSNGIVRMWVNDQLKLEYTNVNIRGNTNYGFGKLNISTYAQQSSPTNGVQWHDDMTLTLTDPDGGTTTPTPCTFSVSPTTVSAPAGGTSGQIAVSASPSGCSPDSWTASENSSWITITSGSSGSCPGTVSYTVAANTGSSRSAAITVAGRSVTITQAAASSTPTPCTFSISPTSASVAAGGGSGQVTVSVGPSGCSPSSWTASSNVSWATITSGSSGSGSGTVGYSAASNSGGSRTGTLTIAGRSFTLSQAAGSTPTDTRLPFSSTFDAGNFDEWDGFQNTTGVTLPTQGCVSGRCMRSPLVAGTNSDNYGDFSFGDHTGVNGSKVEEVWLQTWSKFDSGLSWPNRGQKIAVLNLTNGTDWVRRYQVTLYVNPNGQYAIERADIGASQYSGLAQNIGSVAPVRLGQWDKVKVYAKLNTPGSANGIVRMWVNGELELEYTNVNIRGNSDYGFNRLNVSTYAQQSSPTDGVQWHDDMTLTLTDPDGGGTTPSPCTFAVSPTTVSAPAGGTSGQISVSASPSGCSPDSWTASENSSWITITSGSSGSGPGTVSYTVAANTGSSRSAVITVAGQSVTVTQAAASATPCSFAISPTSASVASSGGSGQVTVSVGPSGCSPSSWTASSNASWVTITSGASGSGPGTVTYAVASNPGNSRSGTLTIAGHSFAISQAAATTPCTFTISPISANVAASGGSGQVTVSVGPSGCSPGSWTASSNVSWATITSGSSGSGSGTVSYAVASNPGSSRTATLTIAGQSFVISQAAATTPGTRLPFASTFDGGNFNEWDGFQNTTGVTLPTQGCVSGRCMRSPLVAGTNSDNYGDFSFGDHTGIDGAKVEEIWLQTWSKFDSGLSWPNRGQKIAVLNLTNGTDWVRRYQVTLYVNPNGQYAIERADIGASQYSGLAQNIGSVAAVRLGQWDKVKVYAKLNTPGSSNGIVRMWVNGELELEYTNVNIRGNSDYGFNRLNVSTYAQQSSPTDGVQWHDSMVLSTTDPEEPGTGVTRPSPPINLRVIK